MKISDRSTRTILAIKSLLFLLLLFPLGSLIWRAFFDDLGANPVEEITHQTGLWGLRILLLTLIITPLRRLSGWNQLGRLRRMLGLYSFFYLLLHVTIYFWLDQGFSLTLILEDILKRPYITVGFATFLMLIPLAATSNNNIIRLMGGKRWKKLHQLVYLSAMGGVIHYLWLVKADTRSPLIYLIVLLVLLMTRLPSTYLATLKGVLPQVQRESKKTRQ